MMFVFLSSPFMYMDPLFNCTKTGDDILKQKDACEIIFQKTDSCQVINDFTITAYAKIYCDMEWARIFIQSAFPIGSFTGLMIMNLVSDTQGRKKAFMIAIQFTLSGIFLLIFGAYHQDVYILMISQFLRGFGAESVMPLCYTLCADFLSDSLRPKAIVFLNSSGGIVSIVLGIFYMLKLNWLTFTIIFQFIPFTIVIISFFFFLQQSPYILMDKKKQAQAREVFHYLPKFNGKQKKIPQINLLIQRQIKNRQKQSNQNTAAKGSIQNVYNTIKNWKYLKPILILIFVNGIAHMNYLGIAYCFSSVGMGYGYNSMVLGVVQFGSILFVKWIATNVPRKIGIQGFYALTMCVGLLYFLPIIENSLVNSTLLIGVSRIFSVSANNLIGCMQTQAFKVQIQSSAIGLIEGLGLWGAIVAPFLVSIAQKVGVHPMALIAVFVSMAIWPPYFLKETFKNKINKEQHENQIELVG